MGGDDRSIVVGGNRDSGNRKHDCGRYVTPAYVEQVHDSDKTHIAIAHPHPTTSLGELFPEIINFLYRYLALRPNEQRVGN